MNKKILITLIAVPILTMLLTLIILFLPSKQEGDKTLSNEKINIIVSILPQIEVVEKIGKDKVSVSAIIPPGNDHGVYEPTFQEMNTISQADIYFRIGHISFEKVKLDSLISVNPSMKVVDTSANNKLRQLEAHSHGDDEHSHVEENHTNDHNDENIAEESSVDPHVWLSPKMVIQQAEIIAKTLSELDSENASFYESNLNIYISELEELDKQLKIAFEPIKGKTILVYHPAFGYLADEYGFIQEHFEIEGKDPSLQDMQKIVKLANSENIKVIFVQKQFSKDSAIAIAEQINGTLVLVDHLSPNYSENMKEIANTITKAVLSKENNE